MFSPYCVFSRHYFDVVTFKQSFQVGYVLNVKLERLDKDLNEFLINTLFKGGLKASASVFVLLRSAKRMIEICLEHCSIITRCATFISVLLLLRCLLKLVHWSIRHEWRKDMSVRQEKIAKIKKGKKRAALGVSLAVMAGYGVFFFALMGAKEPDEDLVFVVGATESVAGIACVISEIITVTKEKEGKRTQSQLTGGTYRRLPWCYVTANSLVRIPYTAFIEILPLLLNIGYGRSHT